MASSLTPRRLPRGATALLAACLLASSACEKPKFEPPDREEQIVEAAASYAEARFDTIAWPTDSIRALEGNVAYSTYCRNCHGSLGEGGTEYAAQRDLEVPSLVAEDWRFEAQPDSVRRTIFVGHVEGMPTWGVAGLTLREIDAVSFYLLDVLRPELLGG